MGWQQGRAPARLAATVPASVFVPKPNVESALVRIDRRTPPEVDTETLFTLVKQGFGQRRKMLRNTMKSLLKGSPLLKEPLFSERPEQLSLTDFVQLTEWVEAWQKPQD